MKTISELEVELADLEQRAKKVRSEIDKRRARTLVRCEGSRVRGCGMGYQVGELEFIQDHWYVEPVGCSDGDYWRPDRGKRVCPHCGKTNFLDEETKKLKRLFKKVVNRYDH